MGKAIVRDSETTRTRIFMQYKQQPWGMQGKIIMVNSGGGRPQGERTFKEREESRAPRIREAV